MIANISMEDVEGEDLDYFNAQYFMKHIATEKSVWSFDEGIQDSGTCKCDHFLTLPD